jgi:RNA polymerase primary sigma factor
VQESITSCRVEDLLAQHGLTAQQEQDLVVAAQRGDAVACLRLIDAFLPAIAAFATGFRGSRVERAELLQAGVAGLLIATRRYDSDLGTPFWAYASFWVRKAMQELVAELARPVVLSDRASRDLARLRRLRHESLQTRRREPTVDELSAASGFAAEHVENLLSTERVPRSLDEPLGGYGVPSLTVSETIVDPLAERAFQKVLDDHELDRMETLVEGLEQRERAVIRNHYGIGRGPRTLSEIGAELGVSAERARQIEVGALEKLRSALVPRELSMQAGR